MHVLAYMNYLEPFYGVIEKEYACENISLYRWVSNPIASDDFKPQIFQTRISSSPEDLKRPETNAPKEIILDYVGWFTLSNFTTLEHAIAEWQRLLKQRLRGKSEKKRSGIIEKWMQNKGEYVVKVNYTPDTAMIGPKDDGIHKQAFLFEGVDGSSLVDKAFEPVKIEYHDADET